MKMRFLYGMVSIFCASQLVYADAAEQFSSIDEALLSTHVETINLEHQLLPNGKMPRAASIYTNNDKSKISDLYAIWKISYHTQNGTQTDTLEIDTTYQDPDSGYYGWDSKHAISCFYEPNLLGTPYSYECLHITQANTDVTKTVSQRYLFSLNGNTLTGKYHSGTVNDFVLALRANQLSDLTGTTGSCSTEAYFNESSGELTLPKVTILGKKYTATLKYEGGDVLRLKKLNPL